MAWFPAQPAPILDENPPSIGRLQPDFRQLLRGGEWNLRRTETQAEIHEGLLLPMATSGIMTVFGEPPKATLQPSSFVVSVLLHAGFFSLLTVRLIQTHHIIERFPTDRFAVRFVDFHSTEPQARPSAASGIRYPGQSQPTRAEAKPALRPPAAGGGAAGSPAVTRITPRRIPASQTLIQPDIPPTVTMSQQTAVPLVVLWTPDRTVVKRAVPALPQTPSITVVQPSLDVPIKEENVSDLKLSSSAFVTQGPAVQPSTTSPIVVHGPEEVKKVPQTSSKQPEPPTPGRVISLSDLRVAEGKVAVPMANQTAKATPGTLIPGQLKDPAPAGNGVSQAKAAGSGSGKGSGDHAGNKMDAAAKPGAGAVTGAGDQSSKVGQGSPGQGTPDHAAKQVSSGAGTQTMAKADPPPSATPGGNNPAKTGASVGASTGAANQGAAASDGAASQSGTVHISLPKDGQFGVVVVGSSVADTYPETAEMWSGRMASTVYLHVGLAKSWILQYALPRLADASGGGHVDAPWPYEIARPNLDPGDLDADAVILHGFVDKDGRFEKLEVVFPAQLAQAAAWVGVLNHWQFRPAKQNGQPVPVEVLLIIPDQAE